MRLSERDIKTGINSEIHASLRRLEDANAISEAVQAKNLGQVVDSLKTTNSNISKLRTEIHKLHDFLEPHIYNDDLQLFQNLYAGNLQVSSGADISGDVRLKNTLTVTGTITAKKDLHVAENGPFAPHDVIMNGTVVSTGRILSTSDLIFDLAGLVQGSWSGRKYTVKTKTARETEVCSTTVALEVHYAYQETYKQYRVWAVLKEGSTVLYTTPNSYTGLEAYRAGQAAGG